ncbi:MAG: hypothetical protein M3P18_04610, partial [Actinomycetota bacterium]|nr:hypothetical protein [Actinomycetota bacterium]
RASANGATRRALPTLIELSLLVVTLKVADGRGYSIRYRECNAPAPTFAGGVVEAARRSTVSERASSPAGGCPGRNGRRAV